MQALLQRSLHHTWPSYTHARLPWPASSRWGPSSPPPRQKPTSRTARTPARPAGVTSSSFVYGLAPDSSRTPALGCHLEIPRGHPDCRRLSPHPAVDPHAQFSSSLVSSPSSHVHRPMGDPSPQSTPNTETNLSPRTLQACAHLPVSVRLTAAGLHTEPVPTEALGLLSTAAPSIPAPSSPAPHLGDATPGPVVLVLWPCLVTPLLGPPTLQI